MKGCFINFERNVTSICERNRWKLIMQVKHAVLVNKGLEIYSNDYNIFKCGVLYIVEGTDSKKLMIFPSVFSPGHITSAKSFNIMCIF